MAQKGECSHHCGAYETMTIRAPKPRDHSDKEKGPDESNRLSQLLVT